MSRLPSYPDVSVFEHDYEAGDEGPAWTLNVFDSGVPTNLSGLALFVPVYDNNLRMGDLLIDRNDDIDGKLIFVLPKTVFDKLGRYSRWYLREGTQLNATLMEGRIVKPQV